MEENSSVALLEHALGHRSTANVTASSCLEVICAWPVSGQYGPGTRFLYYILIISCVLVRKAQWLRAGCVSAVLVFSAVAALHAIVLATLHADGAVDLDIYGMFQLCAIGVLTGPVIFRLSEDFWSTPGRGVIFLWTVTLLAGLLSLVIEFMRVTATICPSDDPASISWATGGMFTYGSNCSTACTPEHGPISSLRLGPADNIYVVPVPTELSTGTTTLIAAGCCLTLLLLLVATFKILDTRLGFSGKFKLVLEIWGDLLILPIFTALMLAVLVKGEMNFWSLQMKYQTEAMQSIVGQWAPVVGTALAILGAICWKNEDS
ncbi:hypothetical protein N7463_004610 [Penicillium fimorum]|uniref:Uncharacterized protein n=1 Tax=Penicillium fimorum TaxID=1882269 RepID=A0A9X0CAE4_9EURO|nr:hypothetical protein N7463_004610 [Penicillium fimorum]